MAGARSSRRSLPCSTSCRIAVAVNILECDATRKTRSGVICERRLALRVAVALAQQDLVHMTNGYDKAGQITLPTAKRDPAVGVGSRFG